jgi:hypothetical protein
MPEEAHRERVIYLFGAGATHACIKAVNSAYGILMKDLNQELADRVRELVQSKYPGNVSLDELVNNVINEGTDFEHVITFLDESCSRLHSDFADDLRRTFESVLRSRLEQIEVEQGKTPDGLYFALLDMYKVPALREELGGILTINYDSYLENAVARTSAHSLDTGVYVAPPSVTKTPIRVLKLHGSFRWDDTWPITTAGETTLWIPPGIQKAKERYPFNILWGLARELLDCDVLRIVGCRLGANDWDLISLLFSTRHTNLARKPYRIEIIDAPKQAKRLQDDFPYLGVLSILEVEPLGSQLIAELTGGPPRRYETLPTSEQEDIIERAGTQNWFRLWLKLKAEAAYRDLGSLTTDEGAFESLLEEN